MRVSDKNQPGQCKELNEFENDLLNIMKTVKFRKVNDSFQSKLKVDINKINDSPNVLVFADKTSNVYEMKPDEYKKILKENITKTYSKAPKKLESAINLEAKQISEKLGLSDRIEKLARNQALKDHKENFNSKPTCRLLKAK